tara:strand:+ start:5463 stop:5594 length:132 start_codon:yes stop_codon:yes gene_type:complete
MAQGTNEYHGDEDEIESARQEKEDNDPRHEPNNDDWGDKNDNR